MLNLILSGFSADELASIRTSVDQVRGLRIVCVDSDHAALTATESGMTIAVVSRWGELPSEQQLELVHRLVSLKIPSIQVMPQRAPVEAKLAALEAGAIDCIRQDAIEPRLSMLLEMFSARGRLLEREVERSAKELDDESLVFHSPRMKELLNRLSRVTALGSTVLLTGETGVGKSTIARWIHERSARKGRPFVDLPCGALPSNLVESELFGHVRGAFTSADRDHVGKFTVASNGSLLLDEVDCLPLEVQGKLLRAVERREFEKVGSTTTEKFEARLIVATNRPLEEEVAAGRFRADLFYRLGVMSFRIPPLRERVEAISPMAQSLCAQFAKLHERRVTGISPAAMCTLQRYSWPGNVRELRNALDYAVAVASGPLVQWSDLPESIRNPPVAFGEPLKTASLLGTGSHLSPGSANRLDQASEPSERELLLAVLQSNNYNRSKTAAALGISRVTLYKRLGRLQLASIAPSS